DDDIHAKKAKIQIQLKKGTIESLKMIDFYSRIKDHDKDIFEKCQAHHIDMLRLLYKDLTDNEIEDPCILTQSTIDQ
ncbi:MAG: hypothetical protein C6H99_05895, partial [Epsilonproteobacteria bacterium]|nr:hypothetical protein [Campylobacterota bacterium]